MESQTLIEKVEAIWFLGLTGLAAFSSSMTAFRALRKENKKGRSYQNGERYSLAGGDQNQETQNYLVVNGKPYVPKR